MQSLRSLAGKNKTWALALAGLLAVLALAAALLARAQGGCVARVYQDGVCIRTVDLSRVREPFRFTVTDAHGHENTVEVEPGRIRVVQANCPDQTCVRTGWIGTGVRPIVCLPARLTIRLEAGAPDVDAVAR